MDFGLNCVNEGNSNKNNKLPYFTVWPLSVSVNKINYHSLE